MSDDITQRLRAAVPKMPYNGTPIAWPCTVRSELLLEAAAGIERQRAENERLREEHLLHMRIAKADAWDEGYQDHAEMIAGIARKPSNPYR